MCSGMGWVRKERASGMFRSEEDLIVRVCGFGFDEDVFFWDTRVM